MAAGAASVWTGNLAGHGLLPVAVWPLAAPAGTADTAGLAPVGIAVAVGQRSAGKEFAVAVRNHAAVTAGAVVAPDVAAAAAAEAEAL